MRLKRNHDGDDDVNVTGKCTLIKMFLFAKEREEEEADEGENKNIE